MIFIYLSNPSHLPHYFNCAKLHPSTPVTSSNLVNNFFRRHNITCIAPDSLKDGNVNEEIDQINFFINKIAKLLEPNDIFIFIERLIDFTCLFIARELVKKNKKVIYWENYDVANSYSNQELYNYTLRQFIKKLQMSFRFKMNLKYFIAHDNSYLGVSKEDLIRWGISVVKLAKGNKNYIFDYGSPWPIINLSANNQKFIVFALGHSVKDKVSFYNGLEREYILNKLLKRLKNLKIKYAPGSMYEKEYPLNLQLNKNIFLEEIALNSIKILISDYSTSLVNCSFYDIKIVSILDMVDITDKNQHKFWKDYLLSKANKKNLPFFPKNIEDLIDICKSA